MLDYANLNAVTSLMVMQGISYATAKKKKGMTVGFVTFENIEQLKNAIEVIIGMFILERVWATGKWQWLLHINLSRYLQRTNLVERK